MQIPAAPRLEGRGDMEAKASATTDEGKKPAGKGEVEIEPLFGVARPATASGEDVPSFIDALKKHRALLPSILGLAFGRTGIIVGSYGSYRHTDEGFFSDGATLVAIAVFAVLMLLIAATNCHLNKKAVWKIAVASFLAEAATLVGMCALRVFWPDSSFSSHFLLSALCTISGLASLTYWLRKARGSSSLNAVIYAFGALVISEAIIYFTALIPREIANLVAAILVLGQFPCMALSQKRPLAKDISALSSDSDFFGFTKTVMSSKMFLTTIAASIGVLAVADGFLRGYPDGDPILFTPITHIAQTALTIALATAIIYLVIKQHQRVMTVGVFLVMEALAVFALILYSAFPDMLDIGAVLSGTLNAILVALTWYIIIAFMTYGWRCPYYYALGGWIVWLGCRAIARIALLSIPAISENDLLMLSFVFAMIVLSTQVTFTQFLKVRKFEAETPEEQKRQAEESRKSAVNKIMGLDEHESLAEIRQATMRHNAEEVGKQFLLSEREIEVLALYALGWTQKRVAEELYISPGTAHAHIKRIYAKTGLHSRQEILDYMEKYTS